MSLFKCLVYSEKITVMARGWLNLSLSLPWQTLIFQHVFLSTSLTSKVSWTSLQDSCCPRWKWCKLAGLLGLNPELAKCHFQYILLVKTNHKGQQDPREGEMEFTSLWDEQNMYIGLGDIFSSHLCTRSITIC